MDAETEHVLRADAARVDEAAAEAAPEVTGQGSTPDAPMPPAVDPLEQQAAEVRGLLDLAVDLVEPALPGVAAIYHDAARAQLAQAIAAVMVKRGWSLDPILGKWKEEISLALVVWPLAQQTAALVRAHRAAAQAKAEPKPEQASARVE